MSICSGVHAYLCERYSKLIHHPDSCCAGPLKTVAKAVGVCLLEPHRALMMIARLPIGTRKNFSPYALNPKEITPEQAELSPCLLVHGKWHNQGVWVSFAKYAKHQGNQHPLYTINLGSHLQDDEAFALLDAKIEEIKQQYKKQGKEDVQVHLVGYSAGAKLCGAYGLGANAYGELDQLITEYREKVAEEPLSQEKEITFSARASIGKMIFLGGQREFLLRNFIEPQAYARFHEILGTGDFLCRIDSPSYEEKSYVVPCSHLELPFAEPVQAKILEWIQEKPEAQELSIC